MESDSTGWFGIHTLASAAASPGFTGTDVVLLIALLVTLVIAGAAAASETAMTSINRIRIRNLAEEGDPKAQRIEKLLQTPQDYLTAILVVSNVSVITASTLATIIAVGISLSGAEVISTVLLSLIVLLFCEITPKSAAVQAPEKWAYILVGPVEAAMFVLLPLIRLLTWITSRLVRLFGGSQVRHGPFVTEDELRMLVEVGEEQGVLEGEEREMIDNVFELSDTTVREVMVPRIDMVTIEAQDSVEEATAVVLQGGQSRIPVYDDTIDNIIGVLYAKDLLRVYASTQHPANVRSLVRPAYFVPESKRLDDLLRELQQQRVHIAIVMDEYGQVAGLVTIEDLVEEIIGDIQDEYDVEEQQSERLGENEFVIDARMSLDDFEELVGRPLPEDGYDTVGGFVYTQLDKIPTIGDTIRFENLAFTVLSTKGRRVTKLRVVRGLPTEDEGDDPAADTRTNERQNEPMASGGEPRISLPPI